MPVQDKFEGPIAYNPAGGTDGAGALVPSAEFQVFDVADSSFSTPLAVFDPATGVTINPLRSSAVGVLPDFQVAGARREVLVRSGSFVTRLTSKYGVVFEAGLDPETVQAAILAGTAAETARAAAVLAKTDAEAAAAEVADVVATNDGIMKAVAENPESAFSIELSRTFVGLVQAAKNPDLLIVGSITRDANQAVTSAQVVWPDGTPGTFTADTLSTAFPGAVDAYHITYGSPVTKTFTQPAITRNSAGAATTVPQIVVS